MITKSKSSNSVSCKTDTSSIKPINGSTGQDTNTRCKSKIPGFILGNNKNSKRANLRRKERQRIKEERDKWFQHQMRNQSWNVGYGFQMAAVPTQETPDYSGNEEDYSDHTIESTTGSVDIEMNGNSLRSHGKCIFYISLT